MLSPAWTSNLPDEPQHRQGEFGRIFQREGAAIRIQAVWRMRVLKSKLDVLLRAVEHKRAIRIQRTIRGFLAKTYLKRRKEGLKDRSVTIFTPLPEIHICYMFMYCSAFFSSVKRGS